MSGKSNRGMSAIARVKMGAVLSSTYGCTYIKHKAKIHVLEILSNGWAYLSETLQKGSFSPYISWIIFGHTCVLNISSFFLQLFFFSKILQKHSPIALDNIRKTTYSCYLHYRFKTLWVFLGLWLHCLTYSTFAENYQICKLYMSFISIKYTSYGRSKIAGVKLVWTVKQLGGLW